MKPTKWLILLTVYLTTSLALGHGIEHTIFEGGVGVTAHYEDGNPLAGKSVTVYSPLSDNPFQQGHTDNNGTFIFAPDEPGTWRIEVIDETGHGIMEEIQITNEMVPETELDHDMATSQKILLGVSLIFGLTGIGFYVTGKKNAV